MISYDILLGQFELFILILMRIASFIYAAPFFNTANTPRKIKVGLAFFVAILVFTTKSDMSITYNGVVQYAVIILKEVIVGILLGVMASFCIQIIMFSGKMIDMDTGLSMAQLFDPTTKIQVGIFGNLYYYMLLLLLMISGLHRYLIAAIVETYNVIPLGQVTFNSSVYSTVVEFMSQYIVLGFRIALPVFAATLLLNVILAILARVAPQMNMFVVGMQLKIFVGIFVVLVTIVMLPTVATMIENLVRTIMSSLVRGMTP